MSANEKVEPQLPRVEKFSAEELLRPQQFQPKSFAPPGQRGIHELVEELSQALSLAQSQLGIIRDRLSEFDRLQGSFYKGQKP
jgi:hypothetical protein